MKETLEEIIQDLKKKNEVLEKRVAALEEQVQAQQNIKDLAQKLQSFISESSININKLRVENGLKPYSYGDYDFIPIKRSDN